MPGLERGIIEIVKRRRGFQDGSGVFRETLGRRGRLAESIRSSEKKEGKRGRDAHDSVRVARRTARSRC